MLSRLTFRPLAIALASVFTLQGCATTNPQGNNSPLGETFKKTFNNDDPCAHSKRNTGIALGALAGAVVGAAVSKDKNRGVGAVIGALAGGGLGGLIGNEIDNRQCEIAKLQQKYQAEIEMTKLTSAASSSASAKANNSQDPDTQQSIGLSVSVVDLAGKPQFASDSATLQPEARAMFAEIAQKYAPSKAESDKRLAEAVKARRVLLIGHTDDTGNSNHNAELSEKRAREVAKLFKEAGVSESQIYYQGAGETLPMADNSTPEGRSKNRRVEIVDVNDEASLQTYLDNRRPNTAFYRPAEDKDIGKTVTAATENPVKTTVRSKNVKTVLAKQPSAPAGSSSLIDFRGKPFTSENAKVSAGELIPPQKTASFSLISEARASDIQRIETCNLDRPRNAGLVKSLKDGSPYRTSEFMPGLYGRSWYDMVGGNLVVLNNVTVLRDSAMPANKPELKVYGNYSDTKGGVSEPDVYLTPDVNTYQTRNGLLYRVFAKGDHGLQCMDVLMPANMNFAAKDGKLIYGNGAEFVSDFKPRTKK